MATNKPNPLIAIVDRKLDVSHFREQHWEGTFWEYLDIVVENPSIARNAFQRVYDMILSYGSEPFTQFKQEYIRYSFFGDPIDHGADVVVHSLTKFLGGHGNSLGGIIVDAGTFDWSKDNKYPMLSEPRPEYHGIKIQETFGNFAFAIACRVLGLRDLGPAISPFNAFLILTGIETLPLRMQKHCENAKAVAEWLLAHPAVAAVNYAGLSGDKYNNLARKYAPKGAGAVFTFSLKGGYEAGVNLVSKLKLFSHLANVGDTRSLVIHPASTTHSQLDDAAKIRSGAAPDVVRLSIGIEDKEDLIADLEQALSA